MGNAKNIIIAVAILAVLSAAGYWFLTWNVRRSLEKADWEGLADLIKAPLGDRVTRAAVIEEPARKAQKSPNAEATGWANASADEIKRAARQADTYVAAMEVGSAALSLLKVGSTLPSTSTELQGSSLRRLDGWGHPFCLAEIGGRVAVISAGPSARDFPGCSELVIRPRDLESLPGDRLYRYPSGVLVLVADGK